MSGAALIAAALKLAGVVTLAREGLPFYFIECEDGANWRIERPESPVAHIGDAVEVEGEREPSVKPRLANVQLAIVSHGAALPPPRELSVAELFAGIMPFGNSAWYGGRFAVEGMVRDINRRQTTTQLLVGEGGKCFQVEMPVPVETPLPDDLVLGACVRVTGFLAWTSIENYEENIYGRIENIELIPQSAADIKVVRRAPPPPFWTGRRIAAAGSAVAVAIALLFAWAVTLRRAVARRTRELAESIRERETERIEADVARRERLRLAADLHDGFQQYLAGAMFRLKAARNYLPDNAERSREHLLKVSEALQHTQNGLRATLWAMNEESEGPESLLELFGFTARRMAHWEGVVDIRSSGVERRVARKNAATLLLVMQEAVGNAIRHGHAAHVRVRLEFGDRALTMTVIDDGCGFDPALLAGEGHYGIASMDRRTRELGGEMSVRSTPGIGTRLQFTVPY